MLESSKNAVAEIQIATVGAAKLNSSLWGGRPAGLIQKRTVNASSRTVIVPAAAPKRRTARKTNASETEMRALIEATLTLNDPVRSVNAAMTTHCESSGSP